MMAFALRLALLFCSLGAAGGRLGMPGPPTWDRTLTYASATDDRNEHRRIGGGNHPIVVFDATGTGPSASSSLRGIAAVASAGRPRIRRGGWGRDLAVVGCREKCLQQSRRKKMLDEVQEGREEEAPGRVSQTVGGRSVHVRIRSGGV